MISRRGLFGASAAGLTAAISQPFLTGHGGTCGKVGKYIPSRITTMHVFAPELEVWDMVTGETVPHVMVIDVDKGRCIRPKFKTVPERVVVPAVHLQDEGEAASKDIFGVTRKMGDHPTRTVEVTYIDSDGNIVYEEIYGQFELNWKNREVPARIEAMREACPPRLWKAMCEDDQFDQFDVYGNEHV